MCSMGGIGVLYGREELLKDMEPFLLGGDMIENVYEQESTYADLPARFEAGTQYVEGAVSLVAAIRYIEDIGFDEIRAQEKKLVTRAIEGMKNFLSSISWEVRIRKRRKDLWRLPWKACILMMWRRFCPMTVCVSVQGIIARSRFTYIWGSMRPAGRASISIIRKRK